MPESVLKFKQFCVALGKVPGTDHTRPGEPYWRNCQDACRVEAGVHALVLVVCDGNGSQPHSEVGALLSSQILARDIVKIVDSHVELGIDVVMSEVLEEARGSLLLFFQSLGEHLHGSFSDNATRYMLATALVAIVTEKETVIAGIGDGYFAVNDELVELGPFAGNAPPYPVYALTGSSLAAHALELLRFTIHRSVLTEEVETLVLMSDGVKYLIEAEGTPMPKNPHALVPPLSYFWSDERFVKNPDNIRRQLALINIETISSTPEGKPYLRTGMLKDDTAIVVVRRMPPDDTLPEEK